MIRLIKKCEIQKCVETIKKSFLTIADEFGLTVENAPRFTAFSTNFEKLENQYFDENCFMYGYFNENKQLLGYYSLRIEDDGQCELNNLCVLPEYRHTRIGRELFFHSLAEAADKGSSKMNFSIIEENKKLRAWYESMGAVHTEAKKFEFFPFTCGYMERIIDLNENSVKNTVR